MRKRVYVLEAQTTAARFVAKNVRVNGELRNETIRISAIEEVDKGTSPYRGLTDLKTGGAKASYRTW